MSVELKTTVAGFTITADSFEPKEDGSARVFTLEKVNWRDELEICNRPATLAKALREIADWLDTFPASKPSTIF